MSKNDNVTARMIATVLRRLARAIEADPALAEKMFDIKPESSKRQNDIDGAIDRLDMCQIYAEGGETKLRSRIESYDVPQLRRLVQRNGLDASKLAEKWRTKTRLPPERAGTTLRLQEWAVRVRRRFQRNTH